MSKVNENSNVPETSTQSELFRGGRKLLSKADYARHRGCSPSAVTRALREKRITTIVVHGKEMIDPVAADKQWSVSTRPRYDSVPDSPRGRERANADQTDDRTADDPDALRIARTRKAEIDAELAAVELDRLAGSLVERSEVDFVIADLGARLRALAEGIPARLSPQLVNVDQSRAYTLLELEMRNLLESLCHGLTALDAKP